MVWGLRKINLNLKFSHVGYMAVLLGILRFILGYLHMVPGVVGVYHDDGTYIATAKALAEGRGYRIINLPDSPYQTKYPPLYPLILLIIWFSFRKFPDNIHVIQLLNILITSFLSV